MPFAFVFEICHVRCRRRRWVTNPSVTVSAAVSAAISAAFSAAVVLMWCCCGGFYGGGAAAVAFVSDEDEALSRTQQARVLSYMCL